MGVRLSPSLLMKIKYTLSVTFDIEREGGWSEDCTLEQVLKQARDEAKNYDVFLKRGGTEPVQVRSKIELTKVQLVAE